MKDPFHRSIALPHTPAVHDLGGIAHLAMITLVCLALAATLGVVASAHLRRRQFLWTWGLIALAPLPVLIAVARLGVLGPTALAVAFAIVLGTAGGMLGWGVHVRLEDHRAGGDRAAAVAQHRGLLDAFRRRRAERGRRAERALAGGLPVGRTNRGELAMVGRGSAGSGHHVLIPGATGAGKTTSLAALLVDYVVRSGFGAVVLEAKTDRVLHDAAQAAAAARGVPFHLFSPTGPNAYDPLAYGSVDERSERLIAVENWGSADADFYRQAASPFLRLVLRMLGRRAQGVTLASVAMHCDPDELENLALVSGDSEAAAEVAATNAGMRSDQKRAIAGLRARLQNLASSEFARAWLDPERSGVALCDLREAIARREVAYFRFDTDRTGNVGRAIAQMVLLDLGAIASATMGEGVGTFVAIDEFGALEAPALDRLYARGRAAGFSVAVGTQTLADLRAAGPAVRERIGATVSAIVCHRRAGRCGVGGAADRCGAGLAEHDPHGRSRPAHLGGDPHPRLPLRGQSLRAAAPRTRRGLRRAHGRDRHHPRPPRPGGAALAAARGAGWESLICKWGFG
jgi:hypothetical protein